MGLELTFADRHLRDICEKAVHARQALGEDAAALLMRRISDLRAVDSVSGLVVGNPRAISATEMAIDIGQSHMLVFSAAHLKVPTLPSGAVDWGNVARLKIVRIEGKNA